MASPFIQAVVVLAVNAAVGFAEKFIDWPVLSLQPLPFVTTNLIV